MSHDEAAERVRARLRELTGVTLEEAIELVRHAFERLKEDGGRVRGFSCVVSGTIGGRGSIHSDHKCWDGVLHYAAVSHHAQSLARWLSEGQPESERDHTPPGA